MIILSVWKQGIFLHARASGHRSIHGTEMRAYLASEILNRSGLTGDTDIHMLKPFDEV